MAVRRPHKEDFLDIFGSPNHHDYVSSSSLHSFNKWTVTLVLVGQRLRYT